MKSFKSTILELTKQEAHSWYSGSMSPTDGAARTLIAEIYEKTPAQMKAAIETIKPVAYKVVMSGIEELDAHEIALLQKFSR